MNWYTFIVWDMNDNCNRLIHLKIKKGKFQETIHTEIILKDKLQLFVFKGKHKEISWMNEK